MGTFDHFPYTNFHELNLQWILEFVKTAKANLEDLDEWKQTHEQEYEQLKEFMDALNNGVLPQAVYEKLQQWFYDNAFDLVGAMVKHVYFSLNDSGYFIVTIPTQWKELVFNTTGLDIETALEPEYGHLTISY